MKNRLKVGVIFYLLTAGGLARALDAFECVHDLIPLTEQAAFQSKRTGVEKPFMVGEKYMAFPEVLGDQVTGFFLYAPGKAWYYDAIDLKEPATMQKLIAELKPDGAHSIYELTVQPEGLETVSMLFMPGYGEDETTKRGPMVLGLSVLPVVGALVSRSNDQLKVVYHNPSAVDESTLKEWAYHHTSRRPADAKAIEISHKMAHLSTKRAKGKEALWGPIYDELKLRKKWVQTHNLDEAAFKNLSHIMETSCRE